MNAVKCQVVLIDTCHRKRTSAESVKKSARDSDVNAKNAVARNKSVKKRSANDVNESVRNVCERYVASLRVLCIDSK